MIPEATIDLHRFQLNGIPVEPASICRSDRKEGLSDVGLSSQEIGDLLRMFGY